MSVNDLRFTKLLMAILDWDSDCCHYDEEKGAAVIEGTEEDIYNVVMQDDEIHLLGSQKVRAVIHMYYTDYDSFSCLCRVYKAH